MKKQKEVVSTVKLQEIQRAHQMDVYGEFGHPCKMEAKALAPVNHVSCVG